MYLNKGILILLTVSSLWLLSGCSEETVSLEEALLAGNAGEAAEAVLLTGSDGIFLKGQEDSGLPDREQSASEDSTEGTLVYVYVCGAVKKPGVYALQSGSRIVAAVEAAGGFLPEAATEAVNLAERVLDGIQITVPDITEYEAVIQEEIREENGLVNLNTATEKELCSLSGIGETRAQAIIAYREEIDGFKSTEQLKEVSGIGDSLFNQIKNNIYIE